MKLSKTGLHRTLIGGAMLAFALFPHTAWADSVQVVLDGRQLNFDVAPILEDGTTLVPVRGVLTPLGATFSWDQATHSVTVELDGTEIRAAVGSSTALVNGESVHLTKPVINRDGRVMIPLRFFGENLGLGVEWEQESHTVYMSSRNMSTLAGRGDVNRSGAAAVTIAQENLGSPYAWGGTNPAVGFDCSGFAYYVGQRMGVDLPRTAAEQSEVGTAVSRNSLAAGDLVFFSTYGPGVTHVGVYDGDGGFIHSQSEETGVVRTSLSSSWWSQRYMGARRVFR